MTFFTAVSPHLHMTHSQMFIGLSFATRSAHKERKSSNKLNTPATFWCRLTLKNNLRETDAAHVLLSSSCVYVSYAG